MKKRLPLFLLAAISTAPLWAATTAEDVADNNFKRDLESFELGVQYIEKMKAYTDGQQQTIEKIQSSASSAQYAQEIDSMLLVAFNELRAAATTVTPPFLMEERNQRFELTRSIIDNPALGQDQKLRSLLENYFTEIDYGKSIASYKSSIKIKEDDISVDVLRVGISTFIAKMPGGASYMLWDSSTGSWAPVAASKQTIDDAFKMSRNAAAQDIMLVPSIVVAAQE